MPNNPNRSDDHAAGRTRQRTDNLILLTVCGGFPLFRPQGKVFGSQSVLQFRRPLRREAGVSQHNRLRSAVGMIEIQKVLNEFLIGNVRTVRAWNTHLSPTSSDARARG